MSAFPYAERAKAVRAAQRALNEASDRRFTGDAKKTVALQAWKEAAAAFRAAHESAYPPYFRTNIELLAARNSNGADGAIEFLEADPVFLFTGWEKARIVRLLRRVTLTSEQNKRLIAVVVNLVRRRNTYEFREYCKLAYHLRDKGVIKELEALAVVESQYGNRRPSWMLDSIARRRFAALRRP